jgi:hypothetical protein
VGILVANRDVVRTGAGPFSALVRLSRACEVVLTRRPTAVPLAALLAPGGGGRGGGDGRPPAELEPAAAVAAVATAVPPVPNGSAVPVDDLLCSVDPYADADSQLDNAALGVPPAAEVTVTGAAIEALTGHGPDGDCIDDTTPRHGLY